MQAIPWISERDMYSWDTGNQFVIQWKYVEYV